MSKELNIEQKIKDILSSHGIKINIHACGCCDSPIVSMEYKGELIANEIEYCNIKMIT